LSRSARIVNDTAVILRGVSVLQGCLTLRHTPAAACAATGRPPRGANGQSLTTAKWFAARLTSGRSAGANRIDRDQALPALVRQLLSDDLPIVGSAAEDRGDLLVGIAPFTLASKSAEFFAARQQLGRFARGCARSLRAARLVSSARVVDRPHALARRDPHADCALAIRAQLRRRRVLPIRWNGSESATLTSGVERQPALEECPSHTAHRRHGAPHLPVNSFDILKIANRHVQSGKQVKGPECQFVIRITGSASRPRGVGYGPRLSA
jgi:hypothetical protein